MGTIETLRIGMVVDTKGVDKGCKDASSALGVLEDRAGSVTAAFRALAGTAVVGSLAAAGSLIVGLAKDAATLEEGMNKVDAVFGSTAKGIKANARDLASTFGISINEVVSDYGRMGSMLGGAGFDNATAAQMSDSLVKLANDLGRFNDVPFEDAFQKLRSGLAGESEPLRDFGIFLSEDAVKARALAMGLGTLSGRLTDAEKIQARANIIFEQAGPAIGAAAREMDGASAKLEAFKGRLENLKITVGQTFAPAVGEAFGAINDGLKLLAASWEMDARAAEDAAKRTAAAWGDASKAADLDSQIGWGEVIFGTGKLAAQATDALTDLGKIAFNKLAVGFLKGTEKSNALFDRVFGTNYAAQSRAQAAPFRAAADERLSYWQSARPATETYSLALREGQLSAPAIPGASTGPVDKAARARADLAGEAETLVKAFAAGLKRGGLSEAISRAFGPENLLKARGLAVGAGALGGSIGPVGGIAQGLFGGLPGPRQATDFSDLVERLTREVKKPVEGGATTSALRLGSAEATRVMATARVGGSRDPVARNTDMTVKELRKQTRELGKLNRLNSAREAPPVFVA